MRAALVLSRAPRPSRVFFRPRYRYYATSESNHGYDFDLIVIGGGSGGIAAAREASKLGAKVGLYDYVTESPQGSTWGLGGTCVNVGCIPKKLFHFAGSLRHTLEDARDYGWEITKPNAHNWSTLTKNVRDHIKSLNFGYKVDMRENGVIYMNERAAFVDPHTVEGVNKSGEKTVRTAQNFIVAVGGRPTIHSDVAGIENVITSDDLFTLQKPPDDTLVVGGGYVALECAGFLTSLGYKATVMVRSIFLRGFDQQMSEMVGNYMKSQGTTFIRPAVPLSITRLSSGKLRVEYKNTETNETASVEFDTVLYAAGRKPVTDALRLETVGVKMSSSTGKIIANNNDRTTAENIYALGDCVMGRPELTPTAIKAGRYLAQRLFGKTQKRVDYANVATTVFTPMEYSCVGLSEEDAILKFGEAAVEVFHAHFTPLEHAVPHMIEPERVDEGVCYMKLVCNKLDDMRVVGVHIFTPNSSEIIQGFAMALSKNVTKEDFDDLVGIHPTIGEEVTSLTVTKRSGADPTKRGC